MPRARGSEQILVEVCSAVNMKKEVGRTRREQAWVVLGPSKQSHTRIFGLMAQKFHHLFVDHADNS